MRDLKEMSLIELLGIITTFGEKGDGHTIKAEAEPFEKELLDEVEVLSHYVTKGQFKPTHEQMAQGFYLLVMEKFNACSDAEKRNIVRSDAEFKVMMQAHIAKLFGFLDEQGHFSKELKEIYADYYVDEEVPRIARGNEMLWSELGDPKPQRTDKQKKAARVFNEVVLEVWDAVEELYPKEYATVWPIYDDKVKKGLTIGISKSNKEFYTILMRAKKDEEYYKTTIRHASNLVVDFIASRLKMNPEIKKVVYFDVTKKVWEQLVGEYKK